MNLIIKPLMPELTADYLDFFDKRAFADDRNNPNGPCYCNAPTLETAEVKQMVSEFGHDVKGALRRNAAQQLAEGRLHGYLAFDGETSIGWCNAGDMKDYPVNDWNFVPPIARQIACGNTLSIVCFAIAPAYYGQGIATAMLERAIADARSAGYMAVEGYGDVQNDRVSWDFHGPVRLYEKAGFTAVARKDGRVVMRKELQAAEHPESNRQPGLDNQWSETLGVDIR
jgi:GNAT superfamily N-acetyltransferase